MNQTPENAQPIPNECPASGQWHSYGSFGPNGERQCEYCGQPDLRALFEQIGCQMVQMTTTVREPDEWLMIPELWKQCMEERDAARAELASLRAAQPEGRKALVEECKALVRAAVIAAVKAGGSSSRAKNDQMNDAMEDAWSAIDRLASLPPAQAAGEPEALQALNVSELNARLDHVYAALKDGDCLGASLAMESVLSICQRAATPPAEGERTTPVKPLTETQAIKLWHADALAHKRTSAFEWFVAGILAAERHHGFATPTAAAPEVPAGWGSLSDAEVLRIAPVLGNFSQDEIEAFCAGFRRCAKAAEQPGAETN